MSDKDLLFIVVVGSTVVMATVTDESILTGLWHATVGAGIVLAMVFVPVCILVMIRVCSYNLRHPARRRDCFQMILNTVLCCFHIELPPVRERIDIPEMDDQEFGLGEYEPQPDDDESMGVLAKEIESVGDMAPTLADKELHRD